MPKIPNALLLQRNEYLENEVTCLQQQVQAIRQVLQDSQTCNRSAIDGTVCLQQQSKVPSTELAAPGSHYDERYGKAMERLLGGDDIHNLPKDWLLSMLSSVPEAAQLLYKNLHHRPGSRRYHSLGLNESYSKSSVCENILTLIELPGGPVLALKTIMHHLCAEPNMWRLHEQGDRFTVPLAHAFDKLALYSVIVSRAAHLKPQDVINNGIHYAATRLQAQLEARSYPDKSGDLKLDKSVKRWMLKRMPRGTKAFAQSHFLPLTLRYREAITARSIAESVVPKVAAQRLPEELLDLIKDYCYDREFLESAADLTDISEKEAKLIHRRHVMMEHGGAFDDNF